jgi:cysteine desulfurase
MQMRVYLDYNATTPVDRRVLDAMVPWYTESWGNAASRDHAFGWDAAEAVEQARSCVAELINAQPPEIIFTSSATESINHALRCLPSGPTVTQTLTATTEHEAVLASCRLTEAKTSMRVATVSTDRLGRIASDAVSAACQDGRLGGLSLALANNEIGTLHPVAQFARAGHALNALIFSDITQAVGKIGVDVLALGLDLAAFSAHKLCGPKGVGALFIREGERGIELEPLLVGGGHERGLRAGTLNVPGIVGFGEACRIAKLEMQSESERVSKLRDRLEAALLTQVPNIWINGDTDSRLPNTTNIGFKGVDARTLIRDMHDIACSTRSACSSGNSGPSHVLKAIGLTDEDAYSCIRFSLGRFTTEEEIDYTINKVVNSVHKLRRNKSVRR